MFQLSHRLSSNASGHRTDLQGQCVSHERHGVEMHGGKGLERNAGKWQD